MSNVSIQLLLDHNYKDLTVLTSTQTQQLPAVISWNRFSVQKLQNMQKLWNPAFPRVNNKYQTRNSQSDIPE